MGTPKDEAGQPQQQQQQYFANGTNAGYQPIVPHQLAYQPPPPPPQQYVPVAPQFQQQFGQAGLQIQQHYASAVHQAAPEMQPVAVQPPPPQYVATVQAAQPQQHFMLQQSLMERNQKLYEVKMKLIELEIENDQLKFMASLNGNGGTTTADADNNGGNGTKGSGQENEKNGNRSQSVMSMSSAISLSNFEEDLQLQQYFGKEKEEDIVYIGEKESADAKHFSRMLNLIQKALIEKKPAVAEFICTNIFAELMEKYGRNHRNLAVYHDSLAKAYRIQRQYSRSRAELEELLQIHKQNNNQRGIASALKAKMICYMLEKKYDKAIQACHQAVVIFKEIHGTEKHPDVGKQLYYQALIYSRRARAHPRGYLCYTES